MTRPRLTGLVIVLVLVGLGASWDLHAERRVDDPLGTVVVTFHAGFDLRAIDARVRWANQTANPGGAEVLLHPAERYRLRHDIPDAWYDGESSLTLEQLAIRSQGLDHFVTLSPVTINGTDVPYPSWLNGSNWYGATADSVLWLRYERVTFTGSRLRFEPRFTVPAPASSNLWWPTETTAGYRLPNGTMVRLVTRVNLGQDLTTVPEWMYHLVHGERREQQQRYVTVILLPEETCQGCGPAPQVSLLDSVLYTYAPENQVVLGRYDVARYAVGYSQDRRGRVSVQWRTPYPLLYSMLLMVLTIITSWAIAYWISIVVLGERPLTLARPFRQSILVLFLTTIVHIVAAFAIQESGHVDVDYFLPLLQRLYIIHTALTLPLAGVLWWAVCFHIYHRREPLSRAQVMTDDEMNRTFGPWSVIHLQLAFRTLVSALMPAAGSAIAGLALFGLIYTLLVVFMSTNQFLKLVDRRHSPIRTLPYGWQGVAIFYFLALAVVDLWLLGSHVFQPLVVMSNSLYALEKLVPWTLALVGLVLMVTGVGGVLSANKP